MGFLKPQLEPVKVSKLFLRPPTDAIGYKVIVSPGSIYQACWEFAILVDPKDQDIANACVRELCDNILSVGDHYSICPLQFEDDDDASNLPVLSYVPESEGGFEWVTVPKHFLN